MSKVSEKLYKPTEVEAANVDLRAKLAEVEAAEPVEPVKFAPNVKRYGASP